MALCLKRSACLCYSLLYREVYKANGRSYRSCYIKRCFFNYLREADSSSFASMTRPLSALQQPELRELIRELRQALGLTQEKFAAHLGVTFPTVNRWENRRATPSPLAMEKLEAIVKQVKRSGTDLLAKYLEQ
jgi:putative transcriptional regulator